MYICTYIRIYVSACDLVHVYLSPFLFLIHLSLKVLIYASDIHVHTYTHNPFPVRTYVRT